MPTAPLLDRTRHLRGGRAADAGARPDGASGARLPSTPRRPRRCVSGRRPTSCRSPDRGDIDRSSVRRRSRWSCAALRSSPAASPGPGTRSASSRLSSRSGRTGAGRRSRTQGAGRVRRRRRRVEVAVRARRVAAVEAARLSRCRCWCRLERICATAAARYLDHLRISARRLRRPATLAGSDRPAESGSRLDRNVGSPDAGTRHRSRRLHRLPRVRAARSTAVTRSSGSTTCRPARRPTSTASRCASSRGRSSTPTRSPTRPRAPDAIVHLAARPSVPRSIDDPVASHEANATGTLRVLEAARTLDDADRGRRIVVVGVRRQPHTPQTRGPRHPAAQPLRRQQARHRAVRARLAAQLRAADAGVPLLQRVRPPPGARPRLRRRGPGVLARSARRRTAHGARRRHADHATSPTSARSPR